MLRAIQGLFERGLLAETSPGLRADIQSLAISDDGRCTRYVSADGGVRSIARVPGDSCPADRGEPRTRSGNPARSNETAERSFKFSVSSGIADRAGTVVLGSAAGYLQIVEPPTVAPPFRVHNHEITTAYVSPTGRYVAAASSLWKFKVSDLAGWDRRRGAPEVIVHNTIRGLFGWLRWWNIFKGDTTHVINAFAIRESQPGPLATAREDGAVESFPSKRKRKCCSSPRRRGF